MIVHFFFPVITIIELFKFNPPLRVLLVFDIRFAFLFFSLNTCTCLLGCVGPSRERKKKETHVIFSNPKLCILPIENVHYTNPKLKWEKDQTLESSNLHL